MKKKILFLLFTFVMLLSFKYPNVVLGQGCGSIGQVCCNGICPISGSCQAGICSSATNNPALNPVAAPPSNNNTRRSSELCGPNNTGINTAIGCIPVLTDDNGATFMAWVLRWSVGIGGGIAFLLILYASFMIMTSQGNPERLKAGQELLTSAISGLLLLIFSIFILKAIGVDILGLDVFGFGK